MKDLAWIDHLAALSHLSFEGAEKEKMAAKAAKAAEKAARKAAQQG